MSSRNDITGDRMTSKPNNKAYEENWERIFGKKKQEEGKDKDAHPDKDGSPMLSEN